MLDNNEIIRDTGDVAKAKDVKDSREDTRDAKKTGKIRDAGDASNAGDVRDKEAG